MSSRKSYKELENLKTKGKKKYQQRLIEEQEAEDEIRHLDMEEELDLPREYKLYKNQ